MRAAEGSTHSFSFGCNVHTKSPDGNISAFGAERFWFSKRLFFFFFFVFPGACDPRASRILTLTSARICAHTRCPVQGLDRVAPSLCCWQGSPLFARRSSRKFQSIPSWVRRARQKFTHSSTQQVLSELKHKSSLRLETDIRGCGVRR